MMDTLDTGKFVTILSFFFWMTDENLLGSFSLVPLLEILKYLINLESYSDYVLSAQFGCFGLRLLLSFRLP